MNKLDLEFNQSKQKETNHTQMIIEQKIKSFFKV